ncbi:MAG TPA: glycosyltransferase [Solirubrobacteraceae bacterium]|jgi:glycosyltransferase involved in cell wall biosynthesis|nr:glycosyltransferase [Solirubrobacteraceae bacterium]
MSGTLIERLRERFPRVAVVHDWLTIPGGSEDVVIELLEMFPKAELFTSVYDPEPWPEIVTERPVHASYLNRIPGAQAHYPKLLPLMTRAYRSFDFSRFDLVLSSSHACAKNVRTPPGVPHVCYCHTPMRYAWDESLLEGEEIGRATRLALPLMLRRLRRQDVEGATSPDVFVANSRNVADRIRRYYGRSAEVVNPPVDVQRLLSLPREQGEHYLVFGRVVPYKRVELAVAACARLGRPLKVAGDGRAMASVRAAAAGHSEIELLGRVDDAERDALMGSARALLFPGEEDFGIVPVEAQAAGLPVIAYEVGGASETVIEGRTGALFEQQSALGLAGAIERFEGLELDEQTVRQNAERFGRERFRAEMAEVIERATSAQPARA